MKGCLIGNETAHSHEQRHLAAIVRQVQCHARIRHMVRCIVEERPHQCTDNCRDVALHLLASLQANKTQLKPRSLYNGCTHVCVALCILVGINTWAAAPVSTRTIYHNTTTCVQ